MGNKESIHLQDFLQCKNEYEDNQLNEKWNLIKNIRKVATGAIEKIREEKIIRSSLEAHIDIFVSAESYKKLEKVMFDEITITSSFSLYVIDKKSNGFSIEDISDVIVKASKVNGEKCQRCWKYEAKLINDEVCNRCNTVIFK